MFIYTYEPLRESPVTCFNGFYRFLAFLKDLHDVLMPFFGRRKLLFFGGTWIALSVSV
jgi:hypothetical protein